MTTEETAYVVSLEAQVGELKSRIVYLSRIIHSAHGLISPLGNRVTPNVLAIREATAILKQAYRPVES